MTELLYERIRRLRRATGYTQASFAARVGADSRVVVSNWETGAKVPSTNFVARIAAALNCSADYLLTGREAPQHAALIAAVRAAGSRDSRLAALVEGR